MTVLDPVKNVAAHAVESWAGALPRIDAGSHSVAEVLHGAAGSLDEVLPGFLKEQRWFAGKGNVLESVRVADTVPMGPRSRLLMVEARYANAPGELYASGITATPLSAVRQDSTLAPLAIVNARDGQYLLSDAAVDPHFTGALVDLMQREGSVAGQHGALSGSGSAALNDAVRSTEQLGVTPLSLHSSNTSVTVQPAGAEPLALKHIRRHDADVAPGTPTRALDVVKGAYLTRDTGFRNTPAVLGALEYTPADGAARTVGVIQEFVANEGDTWTHALGEVSGTLAAATAHGADSPQVAAALERYEQAAATHGRRLGELHRAFASSGAESQFHGVAPTADELAQSASRRADDAVRTIAALRSSEHTPGKLDINALAADVRAAMARHDAVLAGGAPAERIHVHGDFHLGQMLKTGGDVQIIDLEGAPMLPVAQRWERADALTDVARQRSSYEYAAAQGLRALDRPATTGEQQVATAWAERAKDAFTREYRAAVDGASFVPSSDAFGAALSRAELDNALYETSYELGSRPDWLSIPLDRLQRLASGSE